MFDLARTTSIKDPGFIELLTQFLMESGREVPGPAGLNRLEEAVRKGRIRFYMALEDRRVIGVVSLTVCFSMPRMRPYAMLSDLYVHPGHRGRGAAAFMLVGAMDASHREGCAFITTDLGEPLVGIFLRHGWNEDGGVLTVEIDPDGPPPSLTLTGDWHFD